MFYRIIPNSLQFSFTTVRKNMKFLFYISGFDLQIERSEQ